MGFIGVERGYVLELGCLLLDRMCDLIVAVPHADGEDAAKEIQVFPPLHVIDQATLGVVDDQRFLVVIGDTSEEVAPVFFDDLFFFHLNSRVG